VLYDDQNTICSMYFKDASSLEGMQNPTYGTLGHFKSTTDNASTLDNIANGTVIANEIASTQQESPKSDNMEELIESVSNRYDVHHVYAL